jgi:phosphoserine phosphatase RsbU/P
VLAAALAGPRVTAAYAVLALIVAGLLGITEDLYQPGWQRTAQLIRLGGVALGGVMAVVASRARIRRETKLEIRTAFTNTSLDRSLVALTRAAREWTAFTLNDDLALLAAEIAVDRRVPAVVALEDSPRSSRTS